MRQLLPASVEQVDLASLYAHPPGVVRANMVSTLDGSVRDARGVSDGLSGPADKRVFGALRAASDVVLVGAGTVRAECYGPVKVNASRRADRLGRGQSEVPPLAVVSRSLDLDLDAPLFTSAEPRPILLTSEAAPRERRAAAARVADVVLAGEDSVDAAAAIAELADRGLTRVLCEGGPTLLAALVGAGLLDELCLTLALRIVPGGSGRLLEPPAVDGWTGEVMHLLSEDDLLFLRLARPAPPTR